MKNSSAVFSSIFYLPQIDGDPAAPHKPVKMYTTIETKPGQQPEAARAANAAVEDPAMPQPCLVLERSMQ
jgi:hypothetical protein